MSNPYLQINVTKELLEQVKTREKKDKNSAYLVLKNTILKSYIVRTGEINQKRQTLLKEPLEKALYQFKQMTPSLFLEMLYDFMDLATQKVSDQEQNQKDSLLNDDEWRDMLNDFYLKWHEDFKNINFMQNNSLIPDTQKGEALYNYLLCIYSALFGDFLIVTHYYTAANDQIRKIEIMQKEQQYKPDYKSWAQRGRWETIEAACLFAGVDPTPIKHDKFDGYWHPHVNYQAVIKPVGDVIKDWYWQFATKPSSPLQWIDKALCQKYDNIPTELLEAVKEIFVNHIRFDLISANFYPFLAERCVVNANETTSKNPTNSLQNEETDKLSTKERNKKIQSLANTCQQNNPTWTKDKIAEEIHAQLDSSKKISFETIKRNFKIPKTR